MGTALIEESPRFTEIGFDVVSAAVCTAIFFLVYLTIPKLSFLLQQRALRFFLLAAVFFVIAELLEGMEALLAPAMTVIVIENIADLLVMVCVSVAVYLLYKSEREEIASLRHSANMDELTALRNRSSFRRAAQRRMALSKENNLPLSCVVLDIDDFKDYNDRWGHQAGDQALRCVAQVLKDSGRADDLIARYGGEEFVLLMNSSLEDAARSAERLRMQVESRCSQQRDPSLFRQITVSLGVAPITARTETLEELIEAADKEMYCAKRAGKNRVSTAA